MNVKLVSVSKPVDIYLETAEDLMHIVLEYQIHQIKTIRKHQVNF